MTVVYFVRHCKVLYTEEDRTRPLSSEGVMAAHKVTDYFESIKINQVISSPYRRAIDTIKGIAASKGLTIECHEDLRERKVANCYIDDFKTFSWRQWQNFDFKLQGGESLNETQSRGREVLNGLLDKYQGQNLVVGTHGTFLAVILNNYEQAYDYDFCTSIKMPDLFKLSFQGQTLVDIEHIELLSCVG